VEFYNCNKMGIDGNQFQGGDEVQMAREERDDDSEHALLTVTTTQLEGLENY